MLKMSYAGCPPPAISAQFTLKMCVAAENRKKFAKNFYLGGSRSFKLTPINKVNTNKVDTNKKLVTIACYNEQHAYTYLQSFSRYTR